MEKINIAFFEGKLNWKSYWQLQLTVNILAIFYYNELDKHPLLYSMISPKFLERYFVNEKSYLTGFFDGFIDWIGQEIKTILKQLIL